MKNGEVIKGEVKCSDCKKPFIWVYQYLERQRLGSGQLKVTQLYSRKENESMVNAEMNKVYCPKCDYNNDIKIELP